MRKNILLAALLSASALCAAEPSLVPETRSTAPDYFCTWNVQGFASSYRGTAQADAMTESNLFGKGPTQGWVDFYSEIRGDLLFLLDDAWDIPLTGDKKATRGSLELDHQRFPSFQGNPAERLSRLASDIRARGWRGTGLWICCSRDRAGKDMDDTVYWSERLRWCQEAGISYWKVDWGNYEKNPMWRWRLTQLARKVAPGVMIENALAWWTVEHGDVFRTYDVEIGSSLGVTIKRIASCLARQRPDESLKGLINCEDEVYLGAGLGCAYGVMRHPLVGNLPSGRQDFCFPPTIRDVKRRLDEVVRAVRWHRLAQPFGVGDKVTIDPVNLHDSWHLEKNESWIKQDGGIDLKSEAPARIARGGLPLPVVTMPADQEPPYVLCSRYPEGAIAVTTAQRLKGRTCTIPLAKITLDVGDLSGPVGVFGEYDELTLLTTNALEGKRILAQDLAGTTPVDITSEVNVQGGRMTIPGAVIHRVGLMAAKAGDLSDPGLVIVVPGVTKAAPVAAKPGASPVPATTPAAADPGASGFQLVRARWGAPPDGSDVTAKVAALVKEGTLNVTATTNVLGESRPTNPPRCLEVEYLSAGSTHVVWVLEGEGLFIDKQGKSRALSPEQVNPPLAKAEPVKKISSPNAVQPGEIWPDDRGQHIQAHGGGIIKVGDTYYWFGEDRSKENDPNKRYVACYASKDLVHWTFRNQVIKLSDPENFGPGWVIERPKVYYNATSKQYVMYMHFDFKYRLARVGIATCDTVDGDYKYLRSFRPLGKESRDIGQFVDDDGSAYLVFECRPEKGFYIAKLSADYLDVEKAVSFIKAPLEGGAIVHYQGLYYAIGSKLTGWDPNPNLFATASSIEGPWSTFKDIAPPEKNTYGSQSTMMLKVEGTKATNVIFMGDIWKPKAHWDGRYLWMPLEIGDGNLRLPEPGPWKIDVKTGEVAITPK